MSSLSSGLGIVRAQSLVPMTSLREFIAAQSVPNIAEVAPANAAMTVDVTDMTQSDHACARCYQPASIQA